MSGFAPTGGGGTVYLVGAGPGDPGLLTTRAVELIARADVIVYDRLIPRAALAGARADAQLIYAGKEGGGVQTPQEVTTALLIEHAKAGREVVRLKGGDPFVFGRGGEEALALCAEGLRFEVVPGVTAGVAAAAYAGIPVTHRDRASAVALVTGHEDPTKPETAIDWPALAAFPGTLVFYMGVRRLPDIARSLIDGGRPGSEPVAVIERGTLGDQRTVTGTLADIADVVAAAGVRPPSITLVGEVAGLHQELAWWPGEARPLAGVSVAVTRARSQASSIAAKFEALGAEVVEAPAIRTVSLAADIPDLAAYDLLVLTSTNAVRELFARLAVSGRDARALAGLRVAAIGPGTAAELGAHGIVADIVPARSVGEALAEALAGVEVTRALIPRARDAREVVPDALREGGAEVDVLAIYETVAEPLTEHARAQALDADYLTFTSASSVRFFAAAAGELPAADADGPLLASIGPVTSEALRELGREPDLEAADHTPDGLVSALVAHAGQRD